MLSAEGEPSASQKDAVGSKSQGNVQKDTLSRSDTPAAATSSANTNEVPNIKDPRFNPTKVAQTEDTAFEKVDKNIASENAMSEHSTDTADSQQSPMIPEIKSEAIQIESSRTKVNDALDSRDSLEVDSGAAKEATKEQSQVTKPPEGGRASNDPREVRKRQKQNSKE